MQYQGVAYRWIWTQRTGIGSKGGNGMAWKDIVQQTLHFSKKLYGYSKWLIDKQTTESPYLNDALTVDILCA